MQLKAPALRVLAGLLMVSQAVAHSWIEQLMVIAPNGTMVGQPGFPRGNSPRGAGFNEAQMVHLLPPGRTDMLPTDSMCSQTQQNYEPNPQSARLKASAGQAIALRYQENGHVTLPQNNPGKPENRGTIFVYATTDPQPNDALMSIHRVWNAEGTGGDGRGRLLATSNYDDGQCYQVNGQQISQQRQQQFKHAAAQPQGMDLWCQTDILLPSDVQGGKPLTLYWVWDWPTMPGAPGLPQGKQEIYTTCMDIDIVPNANSQQGTQSAQQFNFVQQDIANAAVPAQLKQLGNANAVQNPQMMPFNGQPIIGGSSNGGSSKTSSAPPKPDAKQSAAASSTTMAANTAPTGSNAPPSNTPPGAAPHPPPQQGGQQGGQNAAPGAAPPSPPQHGGQQGGQQSGQQGGILGPVTPIPAPGQQGPSAGNQGQGQNQGQGPPGGNNGNGQGRGGDNGSRPPGAAAPDMSSSDPVTTSNPVSTSAPQPSLTASSGVFAPASAPEFGNGHGTAINGGANGGANAQGQQNPDPRPSTPATAPVNAPQPSAPLVPDNRPSTPATAVVAPPQGQAPQVPDNRPATPATATAQGAPGVTVTQDAEVTVTQYVTMPAGQQDKRESESSLSTSASTSAPSSASESAVTSDPPTSSEQTPATSESAGTSASGEPDAPPEQPKNDPLVVIPVKRQESDEAPCAHNGTATPIRPAPTPSMTSTPAEDTVADNSSPAVQATATAAPCSKTHAVYQLRARAPLYILPAGADPAAATGASC